jgi:hypothetical protein
MSSPALSSFELNDVNESCHARGLPIFILVQYVGVANNQFNINAL